MAITLHTNNAYGYLHNSVATGDTTIVLQMGQGALFPIAGGEYQFYVTVENRAVAGAREIMLCTSRTLDSLSVLRGQQGTVPMGFAAGASVSNRITADFLNSFDARITDALGLAEAAGVAAGSALGIAGAAQTAAGDALAAANTADGKAVAAQTAANTADGKAVAAQGTADGAVTTAGNAVTTANTAAGNASSALGVANAAQVDADAALIAANNAVGALADKANITSPNFLGVPTATTAAPGTDSTQLATTAFVKAAVTAGIGGGGISLESPTFTGDPKAPTPAISDNDTSVATTAFVQTLVAASGNVFGPVSTVTNSNPVLFDGVTGKLLKEITYANFKTALTLVKADVGLANVDNTTDLGKPISTLTQAALDLKASTTVLPTAYEELIEDLVGAMVSGNTETNITVTYDDPTRKFNFAVAADVVGPASSVNLAPAIFSGTTGKLLAATTYPAFKTSLVLVKADVGLGSVDNTTDLGKPISTLTQAALDLKANASAVLDTEGMQDLVGAMVTGSVQTNITVTYNDATNKIDFIAAAGGGGGGDVTGPASSVDNQPALFFGATGKVLKAVDYPTFKGLLGVTKADVGLGSVDNTTDAAKPISSLTQSALNDKANLAGTVTFTGDVRGVTPAINDNDTSLATTAFVQTAITGKANLSGGAAFVSGDVTVPNRTTGDSTANAANTAFVTNAVGAVIAAADAMVYKGVINCSSNPNYPAADAGWTYKVSAAGKIGGGSGTNVEIGDLLLCQTDGSLAGTQAVVGANWNIVQANVDGAVIGPAFATDNNPVLFDGSTGKLIKQATYATFKSSLNITKTDVGLGNVDNTSDAGKPISTLTQDALNLKAPLTSPNFGGTPTIATDPIVTLTAAQTLTGKNIAYPGNNITGLSINGTAISGTVSVDLISSGVRKIGTAAVPWSEGHFTNLTVGGVTFSGATMPDPGGDRIVFWDDSAGTGGETAYLSLGTNLSISGTTLNATGGGSTLPADPGADRILGWDDSSTGTETKWFDLGASLEISGSTLQDKAATTSIPGKFKLPTDASTINAGTATDVAITPVTLKGSYAGTAVIELPICANTDLPINFVGQVIFNTIVTPAIAGMNIINVGVAVNNVATSGSSTFNIWRKRAGAGVNVLSTPITLGTGDWFEYTNTSGVINTAFDDLAVGDLLMGYAPTSTASPLPQGVTMWIEAQKP